MTRTGKKTSTASHHVFLPFRSLFAFLTLADFEFVLGPRRPTSTRPLGSVWKLQNGPDLVGVGQTLQDPRHMCSMVMFVHLCPACCVLGMARVNDILITYGSYLIIIVSLL